MLSYTYNRLDRDKFQYDKNFHVLQARLYVPTSDLCAFVYNNG